MNDAAVIRLPCVGMLPPSFVDFALSRRYADGVMISGCAEGDCHHRLGNEWTIERMARRRDPYLRQRVDTRRLLVELAAAPVHRDGGSARSTNFA